MVEIQICGWQSSSLSKYILEIRLSHPDKLARTLHQSENRNYM